jgi:hypothetical protein
LVQPQGRRWRHSFRRECAAYLDHLKGDALGRVSSRADPVESFHQAVNSKVRDIFFAPYRDFPDPAG